MRQSSLFFVEGFDAHTPVGEEQMLKKISICSIICVHSLILFHEGAIHF
jgi:hypothetical protein